MFANLKQDFAKFREKYSSRVPMFGATKLVLAVICLPQLRAVWIYRIARWFRVRRLGFVAKFLDLANIHLCLCEISSNAEIGPGFQIAHVGGIVIGGASKIGSGCIMFHGVTLGNSYGKSGIKMAADGRIQPVLGDNVIIGAGAVILGPVTVGDNVAIGANAVVVRDIPSDQVAVGVPAVLKPSGGSNPLISPSNGNTGK